MKFFYIRLFFIILIAFILTVMSVPWALESLRPCWILLLMVYLQIYFPNIYHVSLMILLGLILDVLSASIIGQHVFALSLAAWCVSGRARRFKFFSMPQQMAWIFLVSTIYTLTLMVSNLMLGFTVNQSMLLSILVNMLIWPWIRHVLNLTLSFRTSATL